MGFAYPKEVSHVIRQQQFSLRSELSIARTYDEKNPSNPFGVYSGFSRFVAAIVNKEKKPVTGNIPVVDLADIFDRTRLATQFAEQNAKSASGTPSSAAYTVKIASGQFKGKTPAEVLIEDPENKNALAKQHEWLKGNLDKYPNNKAQMEAIVEACTLLLDNKLRDCGSSVFTIYESDLKYLRSRQRADGMVLIYQVKVVWNLGDDYPVEVTITNYYAPIEKDAKTGMTHILSSKRDPATVLVNSMKLTRAEWLNCVREVQTHMAQFEMLNAKALFDDAEKCDRENREQAKQGSAETARSASYAPAPESGDAARDSYEAYLDSMAGVM